MREGLPGCGSTGVGDSQDPVAVPEVGVIDIGFVSVVVALLLSNAGEGFAQAMREEAGRRSWAGLGRLVAVVRARFAGDAQAESVLAAIESRHAGPEPAEDLAAAVRRHADLDPVFRDTIRLLVADAYAYPAIAAELPDPTPGATR
jgi:hypothetical protein